MRYAANTTYGPIEGAWSNNEEVLCVCLEELASLRHRLDLVVDVLQRRNHSGVLVVQFLGQLHVGAPPHHQHVLLQLPLAHRVDDHL